MDDKRIVPGIFGVLSILVILNTLWGPLAVVIWGFFSVLFGVCAIWGAIRSKKEIGKFGIGLACGIIGIMLSIGLYYLIATSPLVH